MLTSTMWYLTLFYLSLFFATTRAASNSSSQDTLLGYTPSNILTSVALALILLATFAQSWLMKKWGGKFMLVLIIGEFCYALGFIFRFVLRNNPNSLSIYIVEYLLILISPCAFLAGNYVLLAHLSFHHELGDILIVPPRRLALIFVSSDVVTFLIQSGGGGISASHNISTANMGMHIALAGVALQLVSYTFFMLVSFMFFYRVYTQRYETWTQDDNKPWTHDWRTLAFALVISSIGILIRSAYRVAEMSEGWSGHLSKTEYFFYCLDTLPLVIAISVYVPFWPGKYIRATDKHAPVPSFTLDDMSLVGSSPTKGIAAWRA